VNAKHEILAHASALNHEPVLENYRRMIELTCSINDAE
jgi:hypothetical protein